MFRPKNIQSRLKQTVHKFITKVRNVYTFFKKHLFVSWIVGSHCIFAVIALAIVINPFKSQTKNNSHYYVYASKPLVLNQSTFKIETKESRAQKINKVFRDYKCPLEGLGDIFVTEADKNGIPWWMVAAISFQESTCGKRIPHIDNNPSYNAWGYAVYGDNVHEFDNWVQGIEVVSRYLGRRFFSQGITDSKEIMRVYT